MERRLRQDWMGEETGAVLWRAAGHSGQGVEKKSLSGSACGKSMDECFGEMETFCIMALNFSGSISNKLH